GVSLSQASKSESSSSRDEALGSARASRAGDRAPAIATFVPKGKLRRGRRNQHAGARVLPSPETRDSGFTKAGQGSSTLEESSARASKAAPEAGVLPQRETSGDTHYSKRHLPHFERPWGKYSVAFSTRKH